MNLETFKSNLPPVAKRSLSKRAAEVWYGIYLAVFLNGQIDRRDEAMVELCRDLGIHSQATLLSHMKKMADFGILQQHVIVTKHTDLGRYLYPAFKDFLKRHPGKRVCYTMPGCSPDLHRQTRSPGESTIQPIGSLEEMKIPHKGQDVIFCEIFRDFEYFEPIPNS